MKVRDVMTPNVVSVRADMTVPEIAKLMLERRISAVPVVDDREHVVGVISEGDLIRRPELGTDRPRSRWLRFFMSDEERAHDYIKTHGLHARDVMSRPVVSVSPEASLTDVVNLMTARHIKRVMVLEQHKLAGVVTRTDLLRALHAREALPTEAVPQNDAGIRTHILKTIDDQPWAASAIINVQVTDGTAYLWGVVDSDEQRKAILVAVEGVPGVRAIEDHLGKVLAG
ncbi:MAG TPA: CBS domain-containing protein [Burkholderiales bacterium]|nr:CBS domain-containing protein [Burkholderiales bacterium]